MEKPPDTQTVIIIEDHKRTARHIATILDKEGYEVVCLFTFDEALNHLKEFLNTDMSKVVAVIFDYILDQDNQLTSIPLMSMFRRIKTFDGVLLANSSDRFFNNLLIEAGCTHTRPGSEKTEAAKYLLEILKSKSK